ncbi:MAG: hypothetical protein ABI396_00950 [Ktedonobacteraceae bacterium]
MNSKQKEAIQRITAQYVAEVRAGHKPKASTYIVRYPRYANEIADFVAYFHAFEEDVPMGSYTVPALPKAFRIAIESANARITQEQLRAHDELPSYLSQVAEAQGPYQLNELATEQTQGLHTTSEQSQELTGE